jgi:hypothetical protein
MNGLRAGAILLIDCRPEENRLEALVAPYAGGTFRLTLDHTKIDAKAIAWAHAAIERESRMGWP